MPDAKPPQDVVEVAVQLADFFHSRNLEYAFGGALALGFWAAPRGTLDVDLTLFVSADEPEECVSILENAQCDASRSAAIMSLREHGFCRITYHGFQLDVFVPTISFYETAKRRRKSVTLSGSKVMIWDAETLCVFKMMFFRLKDLADVEQIVQVQGDNLDRQFVLDQITSIHGRRDPRVARTPPREGQRIAGSRLVRQHAGPWRGPCEANATDRMPGSMPGADFSAKEAKSSARTCAAQRHSSGSAYINRPNSGSASPKAQRPRKAATDTVRDKR